MQSKDAVWVSPWTMQYAGLAHGVYGRVGDILGAVYSRPLSLWDRIGVDGGHQIEEKLALGQLHSRTTFQPSCSSHPVPIQPDLNQFPSSSHPDPIQFPSSSHPVPIQIPSSSHPNLIQIPSNQIPTRSHPVPIQIPSNQIPTRSNPDATQMPRRCHADATQMPRRSQPRSN